MKKEELIKLISQNECIYNGKFHDIKHLFLPEEDSENLIVVFSGFHGKEVKGNAPVYNYINTLENIKANKLFILDGVDNIPVYYLGVNSEDSYLQDTSELIETYLEKLTINKRRVILTGSSKGGTAALTVGLNINAGHIISAANQLYVGRYINSMPRLRSLMFEKIFGNNDDSNVDKLNDIFKKKILKKNVDSKLYFHAGNKDPHYINHMKPMLQFYDKCKIQYELDLRNYVGHNSVVYYFPSYLKRKISEILEAPKITNYGIIPDLSSVNIRVGLSTYRPKTLETNVEIVLTDKEILFSDDQKSLNHNIKVDVNKIKTVKIKLKEYGEVIDTRSYDVNEGNYNIDMFSRDSLIFNEWIDVNGNFASNRNMVRTGRLTYDSKLEYGITGSAYVSYYNKEMFIATKRYKGSIAELPFKLDKVNGADTIVLSFNQRWLDKMKVIEI